MMLTAAGVDTLRQFAGTVFVPTDKAIGAAQDKYGLNLYDSAQSELWQVGKGGGRPLLQLSTYSIPWLNPPRSTEVQPSKITTLYYRVTHPTISSHNLPTGAIQWHESGD